MRACIARIFMAAGPLAALCIALVVVLALAIGGQR